MTAQIAIGKGGALYDFPYSTNNQDVKALSFCYENCCCWSCTGNTNIYQKMNIWTSDFRLVTCPRLLQLG